MSGLKSAPIPLYVSVADELCGGLPGLVDDASECRPLCDELLIAPLQTPLLQQRAADLLAHELAQLVAVLLSNCNKRTMMRGRDRRGVIRM